MSVLGPAYPTAIPELMAYMTLIVRCSQDYAGLAWVRYDMAFRRQAAIAGNRKWSEVNGTLYVTCFTGKGLDRQRCELCLSSSHRTGDCLLQGGETTAFQQPAQHQWQGWVPPPRGTPSQAPAWRQLPPSGEYANFGTKTDAAMRGAGIPTRVCDVGAATWQWHASRGGR